MSDNTVLNLGTGGDTVRTLDRLQKGVKTETMQVDVGGGDPNTESLVSGNNPLPVQAVYDRQSLAVELLQAQLQLAQPQSGFIPSELPAFLGAL